MIGICWNARGLWGARAFRELSRLVREINPSFMFIFESRIHLNAAHYLKSRLNFNFCFNVNPRGSKGGLILFWNDSIKISILSYSFGHIDCIMDFNNLRFYFTVSTVILFITNIMFPGI